jgi:hypothetical protein
MKIIFLDVDGVLNSHRSARDHAGKPGAYKMLDRRAIAAMNRLVDETGAHVVLSSTWRLGTSLPAFNEHIATQGATFRVEDKTPDYRGKSRGLEIAAWLEWHRRDSRCEAFVILDDDPDMDELAFAHVKTDCAVGLTEQDVERARDLLEANDEPGKLWTPTAEASR